MDLLLACYLANTACAIMNIMTALIFIILIVSRLHACILSCCSCPLMPPRARGSCGVCLFPTASFGRCSVVASELNCRHFVSQHAIWHLML